MRKIFKKLCCTAAAVSVLLNASQPVSAAEGRLYNQYDPYWKTVIMHSITGTQNSMYASACGVFSLCNAVYGLNSTEIDAVEFAEWACENGSYRPGNGGTYAKILYENIQEGWGERAGFQLIETFEGTIRDERLLAHLKAGGVAVIHVYNHYMAITGYDEELGLYHVIESACSERRKLEGDSWVTAETLSAGRTKADWFALLANTKAPERASVTTDRLHSAAANGSFTLESDIKGEFDLRIQNAEGADIASCHSSQAARSCRQNVQLNIPEAGFYTCDATAINEFGTYDSEKAEFLVYDCKPQRSEISCEQTVYRTKEPVPLLLKGELAESFTVQVFDETGQKYSPVHQECELSEWCGDSFVCDWIPDDPGAYTARVTMYNDYGSLESSEISFCVEGDVTALLDAQGGEPEQDSVQVPYHGIYGELPAAKKPGYSFDGWFTDAEGGEPVLAESPVSDRLTHTLYAHWYQLPAGDLNADRNVDMLDAVLMMRIVSEDSTLTETDPDLLCMEYADLDGDGIITMQDFSQLLSALIANE
ncbi:MAG: InlB B-repeat-containing protein [Oscillospiraceae bacterium]|nr:InlB B-repeat-containing protein [Oscillospiraceae bacterium]